MKNNYLYEMELNAIQEIVSQEEILYSIEIYNIFKDILKNKYNLYFNVENGCKLGFTINKKFSEGSEIISLFSKGSVVIFNNSTIDDLLNNKKSLFNVDYSIGLDTQALSYLQPFIENKSKNKLPKDIQEIFSFISKPNVNIDCLPYQYENMGNIQTKRNQPRIYEKLRAYEILRQLDYKEFMKNGKIRPSTSEIEINLGTDSIYSSMINKEKYFKRIEEEVKLIYLCLLKITHIEFSYNRKSPKEKLSIFLDFLHNKLGKILSKEAIIAFHFFKYKQKIPFFSKVQKGHKKLLDSIQNMAWDIYHLRTLEKNMVVQHLPQAEHFFPALLTCDKDLIELSKLTTIKAIAINRENGIILPFYDYEKLGDEFHDIISEYDNFIKRKERESTYAKLDLHKLISELESLI